MHKTMKGKKMKKSKLLGILGGLGPLATAYFYELVTALTSAECDQDHIDMVISSRASTPDRSAFILGKSQDDPLPIMVEEAKKLEAYGADIIAIPCNTAHYFYDGIASEVKVPILNIINETIDSLATDGVKRAVLFATEGTCRAGTYQRAGEGRVEIITPSSQIQSEITSFIFDSIKKGALPDEQHFLELGALYKAHGCERIILGCTELSIIKKSFESVRRDDFFADSLEILAKRTVVACGRELAVKPLL